jgi:hypothetical protein
MTGMINKRFRSSVVTVGVSLPVTLNIRLVL